MTRLDASDSPERGGASVMGGECSALPTAFHRQFQQDDTMPLSLLQRVRAAAARLENHWLGDALGCTCLALIAYVLFMIAGCLQG